MKRTEQVQRSTHIISWLQHNQAIDLGKVAHDIGWQDRSNLSKILSCHRYIPKKYITQIEAELKRYGYNPLLNVNSN